MIDDFLWRALAAGLGLAAVAGPLGCFIVWRRMSYFGATLSHAALLGVALGLLLGLGVNLGILIVTMTVALLLVAFQEQRRLAGDTVLGILAHGSLALGLVAIAFAGPLRVDLLSYLFGDILAVTREDLLWIYGGGLASLAALAVVWRPLVLVTVHEELARVEGVPVTLARLVFIVVLALVIAAAMKIVGVLLIVSLLIIPAAAARPFARSPEAMALAAVAAGAVSVVLGLGGSLQWDTPAGPSIVVAALVLFVFSFSAAALRR